MSLLLLYCTTESVKGLLMNTLIKASKHTKIRFPEEFDDYWTYEGMGNVTKKTKKQRDLFDNDVNQMSGVVMPFLGGREVYGLAWSNQVNQMASAAVGGTGNLNQPFTSFVSVQGGLDP